MNKKEVSEIKKLMKYGSSNIAKFRACYVNSEKKKVTELDDLFLCLPEEDTKRYYEIFQKTLSGSIGKNLYNMEFTIDEELSGENHKALLKLRETGLKDEELVDKFFDKVIDCYDYVGNYLILLIYVTYDVPGITLDGEVNEDASEEVFDFILGSICPVELDKEGLSYDSKQLTFSPKKREWLVELPSNGFMFPAFNDRSTDIHELLYYAKKPGEMNDSFIKGALGCETVISSVDQRNGFESVITETLGDECHYEVVKEINERVNEIIELHKEEVEPVVLSKEEVKDVLKDAGVSEIRLTEFEKRYDAEFGEEGKLQATNIVSTTGMKVKTANVEIKVKPEFSTHIETKIIDGKKFIVIPMDDSVEINGIPVTNAPIASIPTESEGAV